jgi:hypothetical protein
MQVMKRLRSLIHSKDSLLILYAHWRNKEKATRAENQLEPALYKTSNKKITSWRGELVTNFVVPPRIELGSKV